MWTHLLNCFEFTTTIDLYDWEREIIAIRFKRRKHVGRGRGDRVHVNMNNMAMIIITIMSSLSCSVCVHKLHVHRYDVTLRHTI